MMQGDTNFVTDTTGILRAALKSIQVYQVENRKSLQMF